MYMYMYIYMYVYIYMYIHTHIYVYIYVYVLINYIYTYIRETSHIYREKTNAYEISKANHETPTKLCSKEQKRTKALSLSLSGHSWRQDKELHC